MKSFDYKAIIVVALIIVLAILACTFYFKSKLNEKDKNLDKVRKELIESDSLKTYGDGMYSKLVNDYNTSKQLNSDLKKENTQLFETIKNKKEKVLIKTKIEFTPVDKDTKSKVEIDEKDSIINYTSKYPDEVKPFIIYNGKINLKSKEVDSKWKFNPLDVDIVLTEKENGIWNTYVDAPEYFKVTKLTVNSLPKKEIANVKNKKVNFYGGVGVIKMGDDTKPTINVGIGNKSWLLSGGFGGTKTYNVGLMRKF